MKKLKPLCYLAKMEGGYYERYPVDKTAKPVYSERQVQQLLSKISQLEITLRCVDEQKRNQK